MKDRPEAVIAVGIDPGRVPGVVVVRIPGAKPCEQSRPEFRPIILSSWAAKTEGNVLDPTVVGMMIALEVLRMATFFEATLIGIEIPKGMRKANVATYGAQRETIGTVRGCLLAHKVSCMAINPNSVKMATGGRFAKKSDMIAMLKTMRDFVKAWDTDGARLEAKADALGVALAAAGWKPPSTVAA